jgi:beta-mannanase
MRPTGPRLVAALITAALVTYTFALAHKFARPNRTAAVLVTPGSGVAKTAPESPRGVFPQEGKDFVGVMTTEGTFDFAPVDRFTEAVKHQPTVMMFSEGWAVHTFDRAAFDRVADRGMLPMLSWEPWNYRDDATSKDGGRVAQPQYRLARIIEGDFDDYIRSYAEGIQSLHYPVAIRLAHEMNGFWYPWGATVNGNQPGDYVKMWRHVHDIFTSAGATNAIWVWSANVNFDKKSQLAQLYPGDEYVDWLGLSGYYGTAGTQSYRSPDAIFNATIADLRGFTAKPLVITETGATDSAGLKAQWIRDFFRYLPKHPDIIGFIWYEAVRETDWRVAASRLASSTFAEGVADPRYAVRWSRDMLPRVAVDGSTMSPSTELTRQPATPAAPPTQPKPQTKPTRTVGRPTPTSTKAG